jgi:Flp pilus assembly protein TadG
MIHRLLEARDGAALTEAALVFPILLMVMFGLVEYGRMAWTANALNFAVQEAARCGRVRPDVCGDAAAIAAFARQRTDPLDIPTAAFSVSNAACGLQVQAAYAYTVTVGALAFKSPPILRASACRP